MYQACQALYWASFRYKAINKIFMIPATLGAPGKTYGTINQKW